MESELVAERTQISNVKTELQINAKRLCDELKLAMDEYKKECVTEVKATAGALKADMMESLSNLQKGLETRIHSKSNDL